MNLKQGRIGFFEGMSLAALSVFTGGVFAIDSKTAYADGNLTYISIPLAAVLSLCVVLIVSAAAERNGCGDLFALMRISLGKTGGAIAALLLAASFVIASSKPLAEFAEVLHRLVYDGVSYGAIFAFMIPAAAFIAWKGFESAGRLALVFSGLILASVIIAAVSAAPQFDTGRLFPFPGTKPADFLKASLSQMLFTLPPLTALAVNARGLGGMGRMRKNAATGALSGAAAIGLTQLALALIYPAAVLSGLLMPLYRINFLSLSRSYALRLDKLFIMVWLSGCLISTAYLTYSAGYLLTEAFGGRDATPFTLTSLLAAALFSSVDFRTDLETAEILSKITENCGFLLALVPLFAASAIGLFGKRREKA